MVGFFTVVLLSTVLRTFVSMDCTIVSTKYLLIKYLWCLLWYPQLLTPYLYWISQHNPLELIYQDTIYFFHRIFFSSTFQTYYHIPPVSEYNYYQDQYMIYSDPIPYLLPQRPNKSFSNTLSLRTAQGRRIDRCNRTTTQSIAVQLARDRV